MGGSVKTEKLIPHLGFAVPGLFWLTLLVSGRIYPGYNPVRDLVSQLGALGTPSQWVFNPGMFLCALLSLVFAGLLAGVCRRKGLSPLPAWLLLVHGVSLGGAALFPLPLAMHARAGALGMFLPLPPLAALILWRGESHRRLRAAAVISLIIMGLGFTVMFPRWLPELTGLKQRMAHLGWSVWFATLGWKMR